MVRRILNSRYGMVTWSEQREGKMMKRRELRVIKKELMKHWEIKEKKSKRNKKENAEP